MLLAPPGVRVFADSLPADLRKSTLSGTHFQQGLSYDGAMTVIPASWARRQYPDILPLSVQARRIERNSSGNRHIKAFAILGNIDPHQPVAMTAGEMAKAGSLGSHHDTEAVDLAK